MLVYFYKNIVACDLIVIKKTIQNCKRVPMYNYIQVCRIKNKDRNQCNQ